jgi:hypothetical protein
MFSPETIEIITRTAKRTGFEPAALMAVVDVETGGRTHALVDGRREPLIRFEGHYFDRRLPPPARETARREGLASPTAGTVLNPPSQAARWRLLERAVEIDRRAAYESSSWGVGQVMGAHWAWLGYQSVDALVAEARSGLEGQLRLMLRYIEKAGLADALRKHDWTTFARGYNGPGFARNSYHLRLGLAYRRHARQETTAAETAQTPLLRRGSRGKAVSHLQTMLTAAGNPLEIDGIFGPATEAAVRDFQRRRGLAEDGIAGPATMAALPRSHTLDAPGVTRTFFSSWQAMRRRLRELLTFR